jgi:hypothetical protein
VTAGSVEADRLPDLARLERVGWPMEILQAFHESYPVRRSAKICWWMNDRGSGKGRYLLALADFSYVVIVADRGGYCLLWTAYPVEYSNRRRRLRQEFEDYWESVDQQRNG